MKLAKLVLAGALSTSALFAHGLWINTFETSSHGKKSVTVGFGYGHTAPIDGALSSSMDISFNLLTPDNKKVKLQAPKDKPETIYEANGLNIKESNLAMQQIAFDKDATQGTYSVAYERPARTIITYINKEGKQSRSIKPIKEIRDLKEIVSTTIVENYGKAYFINGEFSKASSMGHKIEMIPLTDYTKLNIGDIIELEVLFDGEPLKTGQVTAKADDGISSNSFIGYIRNGKVRFILNEIGRWSFNINHKVEDKNVIYSYNANASLSIK